VRYLAPDDQVVLNDPTPEQLEQILRFSSHDYWQQGGNGEAMLDGGPGEPELWIKQPEPRQFFVTYFVPKADSLVPYDGSSCEALVEDERGGNPFWIPRACLVGVDQAVDIVSCFLLSQHPSPVVSWCFWHELPLSDSYPEP
jgi:hypothetical protein